MCIRKGWKTMPEQETNITQESGKKPSDKGQLKRILLVVLLIASIACFCGSLLMDGKTSSTVIPEANESMQIGETTQQDDSQPVKLLTPKTIYFKVSEMEVAGTHIARAISLKEDSSRWRNSPSYIFVGEKVQERTVLLPPESGDAADVISDDEPKNTDSDQQEFAQTSDGSAIVELLTTARIFNTDYFESDSGFLDSCQCIQAGKFIIIVGNERYYGMAEQFENAVNSGTVYSLDDLVSRIDHLSVME